MGNDSSADEEIRLFAYNVAQQRAGAVTAGMIHLGDRLGLYRALHDLDRPVSAAELAEATGLAERWVREWLYNQAAAGFIAVDAEERFWLTPAATAVLADESHEMCLIGLFHPLPQLMQRLEVLPESFRTGVGYDYDAGGPDAAVGIERSFAPWMRAHLVPDTLPMLDGVVDRLAAGIDVADIGCGSGAAVLEMAQAFPASRFVGYDISHHALDRARSQQQRLGVTNAVFIDGQLDPIPQDRSFGLITTFDCLHDMTDPEGMTRTIRGALADEGTWLLVDIKSYDTFAENAARNPMAAMMYAESVLSCMASGLSEPGGAGLGTLGLSSTRAEAMARAAGFTRFTRLAVEHPVNAFYEIRP